MVCVCPLLLFFLKDQADRDKGKDVPDKPAACAMEGPDPSLPSEGQEDGSEDGTTHHSGEEK